MSDIERFVTIWGGGGMMPASSGDWVRYDDHRAEVERLTARQTEMETHITGLTNELHRTRADGIELRWVEGEVEQLTAQRDAAQAEVERLKEQVAALAVAVEQADEMKANAEAAVLAEEAETDRVMAERNAAQVEVYRLENAIDNLTSERDEARAERDAAQRERERLQDLLRCERQELSTLRERLRQLRSDQPAQNLDMANGQAILDSSRPDDETIWREAFMAAIQGGRVYDRMTVADLALADYRKRWPR